MIKLLFKRLGQGALVIFVLQTITFFLVRLLPGNPFLGERKLPEHIMAQLNSLYGRLLATCRKENVKTPDKTALKRLTALLSENLGVTIDHYLLIDLAAFRDTVDAIGGVPMEVPYLGEAPEDWESLSYLK